ncbi:MAG: aminotransferase class V-fold PLP-dependent enzyme [Roseovarius sp.]
MEKLVDARLPGQIINAAGTLTRLSGSPLAPGVMEAMIEAEAASIDMVHLHAEAGARIAAATGAESGLATAGAAAGLMLAAAACLARDDIARMNALPGTGELREIIVARSHRSGYDHAVRTAGARLVEVGLPDPVSRAGVRDVEPWEYAAPIGRRTAAVLFTAYPANYSDLPPVIAAAHALDAPVIVDAAAELPPAANLRRFIDDGADLVVFSGGKVLGGPAGTGILAGRRDLIASAALQCLDLDVPLEDFRPPPEFIDMARYPALPRHGVGRAAKLGKHEIFGLLAALAHFQAESDGDRHRRWLEVCRTVQGNLTEIHTSLRGETNTDVVPLLRIAFDTSAQARSAARLLRQRPVPVHLRQDPLDQAALFVNPAGLCHSDLEPLCAALAVLQEL